MPSRDLPQTKQQVIEQEFLVTRAKLLEAAATLDRLDRAAGQLTAVAIRQRELLERAVAILGDHQGSRAEQLQLLFSREYDPAWRTTFEV